MFNNLENIPNWLNILIYLIVMIYIYVLSTFQKIAFVNSDNYKDNFIFKSISYLFVLVILDLPIKFNLFEISDFYLYFQLISLIFFIFLFKVDKIYITKKLFLRLFLILLLFQLLNPLYSILYSYFSLGSIGSFTENWIIYSITFVISLLFTLLGLLFLIFTPEKNRLINIMFNLWNIFGIYAIINNFVNWHLFAMKPLFYYYYDPNKLFIYFIPYEFITLFMLPFAAWAQYIIWTKYKKINGA